MDVVISQPRYLPALNYLQRLNFSDIFLVLDMVQRQGRGWENRNKLLLPEPNWLSIPVASSSRALICEAAIEESTWVDQHRRAIFENYTGHPYFSVEILDAYFSEVRSKIGGPGSYLSVLLQLVSNVCAILSIGTRIEVASRISGERTKTLTGVDMLVALSGDIGAERYISGPNGLNYGVEKAFDFSAVDLLIHEFNHPVYNQVDRDDFVPFLGFLDAVFSCGLEKVKSFVHDVPKLQAEVGRRVLRERR